MTELEQADTALHMAARLFSEFAWTQLVPLVVLIAIGGGIVWVLIRAQGQKDFDASHFLRDERGQLSWKLLIGAVCFAIHSWAMVTMTIARVWERHESLYLWMWAGYVGIWSGSVVVLAALEVWRSVRLGIAPPMPPSDLGGFTAPRVIMPGVAAAPAPAQPQETLNR